MYMYFYNYLCLSFSFEVSEEVEPGTPVGRVSATDDDKGVDGVVYYYLEGNR